MRRNNLSVRAAILGCALLASALLAPAPARAVEDPRSDDEASLLWNDGMEAFLARKYDPAIEKLKRLTERYPSDAHALDARYYLAQSYLAAKKPEEAIPLFQKVVEASGKNAVAVEARVYLGSGYLDAKKYTEAYLVSDEIAQSPDLTSTQRARGLLLRAQAQSGLKQNIEAEKSLAAFQLLADKDPELEKESAQSHLVTLYLKQNDCDLLPSAKALPEAQLLDQVGRKGLCVLEMGVDFAKSRGALSDAEKKDARAALDTTLKAYLALCEEPPIESPKAKTEALRKVQRQKAAEELRAKLKPSCANTQKLLETIIENKTTGENAS